MVDPRVILEPAQFRLTIQRLCYQLIENHNDFTNTAIIGVQPRGVLFSARIMEQLKRILPNVHIPYGQMDITFYRDDFRRREKPLSPSVTHIDFTIEGRRVVLIDDVLYTGRTIRAAMDALLDYGRPAHVELMVLIDRRFTRHLPVQADYVGKTIDTITEEVVKVVWSEDRDENQVWILKSTEPS